MIAKFTSDNEELYGLLEYDYVYVVYTSDSEIHRELVHNPVLRSVYEYVSKLRSTVQYGSGKIDNRQTTHGWPVGIIFGVNSESKDVFEQEAVLLGLKHGVDFEKYSYKEELEKAKEELWSNLFNNGE